MAQTEVRGLIGLGVRLLNDNRDDFVVSAIFRGLVPLVTNYTMIV